MAYFYTDTDGGASGNGGTSWAHARVCVAKRQASPDTVYVDPKTEIS